MTNYYTPASKDRITHRYCWSFRRLTITSPTSVFQESLSGKSIQQKERPSFVSFTVFATILSAGVLLSGNIYLFY
jgi:hypothetical protein